MYGFKLISVQCRISSELFHREVKCANTVYHYYIFVCYLAVGSSVEYGSHRSQCRDLVCLIHARQSTSHVLQIPSFIDVLK